MVSPTRPPLPAVRKSLALPADPVPPIPSVCASCLCPRPRAFHLRRRPDMSASLLAPRACAPHLPFGRTAPDACERRLTCAGEAPASASSASPLTANPQNPSRVC